MSTIVPRDPLHKPHFGHKFTVNFTTMPTAYTMDTKKVRDRDRHRDGGSGRDRQNNGNKEGCVAAAARVAAAVRDYSSQCISNGDTGDAFSVNLCFSSA